jgi:lysophospholipase L1-like esterase
MIDRFAILSAKRETTSYSRKKALLCLITGILSLSIVLICGEILVRMLLPFNNPDTLKRRSLQRIESLFSRHLLKPTQFVVQEDDSKGKGQVQHYGYFINSVGYRGPDFAVRKPKGIIRIIVIGGSSVFDPNAKDTSPEQSNDWPHLVERLLAKKGSGNGNIEVINAGIPGHASFDALGRLYSQLWMYEPDYVLFYGAWNDIKYFPQLTPEKPLISIFHKISESNPFIEYQGFWDRLLSSSQLYVKFRNQYYGWKFQVGEEGVIPEAAAYQDTYSSFAVKQYQLNVQLIVETCRDIGAIPVLLTEATLVSPNNSPEERKLIRYKYQSLTHTALAKAFEDTYEVIRLVGREKGVAVLDLAKELNGRRELFKDHVHLTATGSAEVAKRVADFLAADLEVRAGSKKR